MKFQYGDPLRRLPLTFALCCWAILGTTSCSNPYRTATSNGETASSELQAYRQEIDDWHAKRIERLKREDGWLTLVGLFPLDEGDNTVGSSEASQVQLPADAPDSLGVIHRTGTSFSFTPSGIGEVTSAGEPVVARMTLLADDSQDPTILRTGSIRFYIIDRGDQFFVRVKDSDSEVRRDFKGVDRFPVDPAWRILARWEPYDPPKVLKIGNVLGQVSSEPLYGAIEFSYEGQSYELHASGKPSEGLFLVFGDATNGDTTYGGGRFLSLDPPEDGTILVDFNRAYDPPCVFTPYATCPLPPDENELPFAVTAGEKMWEGEQHTGF